MQLSISPTIQILPTFSPVYCNRIKVNKTSICVLVNSILNSPWACETQKLERVMEKRFPFKYFRILHHKVMTLLCCRAAIIELNPFHLHSQCLNLNSHSQGLPVALSASWSHCFLSLAFDANECYLLCQHFLQWFNLNFPDLSGREKTQKMCCIKLSEKHCVQLPIHFIPLSAWGKILFLT